MNLREKGSTILRNSVLFLGLIASSVAQAGESYIAVEANSGRIVLELDADQKRPVASLAKIATAMVVLDWAHLSQTKMGQIAVVPAGAATIGGSNPMGLIPGDQIALREAMYSMLLGLDNVSALTLAAHVGRSIQAQSLLGGTPTAVFVGEMNNLARVLGMERTRFYNPHGLDSTGRKGFSTARDMARLCIYAMRDTGFQFYVKQKQRTISSSRFGQSRGFKVSNTHKLLGTAGISGIITGTSQYAGSCAATSSEKKPIVKKLETGATRLTPRRMIVIALGSADRYGRTKGLLSQGWGLYDAWKAQGQLVTNPRSILTVPTPQ